MNILIMVILQAGIAGGFLIIILFGIYLLVGLPLLTGMFMKFVWRRLNKEKLITNNTPYYKDPIWFFPRLLLSIVILGYVFYLLLILVDQLYPGWGLST